MGSPGGAGPPGPQRVARPRSRGDYSHVVVGARLRRLRAGPGRLHPEDPEQRVLLRGAAKDMYAGSKRLRWEDTHARGPCGQPVWRYVQLVLHRTQAGLGDACCTGRGAARLGGSCAVCGLRAPGTEDYGAGGARAPRAGTTRTACPYFPQGAERTSWAPAGTAAATGPRVSGARAATLHHAFLERHSRPAAPSPEDMNGFQQGFGWMDMTITKVGASLLIPCLPVSSFKEKLFYHSRTLQPLLRPPVRGQ